jgi:hypothetical protein
VKLFKTKKLKDQTVEELEREKKISFWCCLLALASGFTATFASMCGMAIEKTLANAALTIALFAFSLAVSMPYLISLVQLKGELRLREEIEKLKGGGGKA